MKKILIVVLLLPLIFYINISAYASEFENIENFEQDIEKQLNSAIDDNVLEILDEIGIDDFNLEAVYNISFQNITDFFSQTLKEKIRISSSTFLELLSVLLLISVVSALFIKDSEDNFISFLSVIIITLLTVNTISGTLSAVVSTLKMSSDFMIAFVPIYTLIISLSGNAAAALTYDTLVISLAEFISYILTTGITDFLGVFFCVGISFSLNSSVNIPRLISAINKIFSTVLGLTASVFSGVLSIKSILSASVDSISTKGIRFLIGSLIPIVGSSISDAYSSFIGSINLIRGSVAVIGILVIVIINVPIILETLVYYISLNMLSFVAEAVSAKRAGDILRCFSCGMRILMLVSVFEMFILIISTGILLSVKNGG